MICPVCTKEVSYLTKDHICPQSIIKIARMLGVKLANNKHYKKVYGHKHDNIRMICPDCNFKKGSKIDTSDKYSMMIVTAIKEKVSELID